jgi:hypothetical protein
MTTFVHVDGMGEARSLICSRADMRRLVIALVLSAACGDEEGTSASGSGTGSGSAESDPSTASGSGSISASGSSDADPTDPNACPPYEGMGQTCPVQECCDDEGRAFRCECPAQCESNCCLYSAASFKCIGPSGPDGIYTCGSGVDPTATCPDGREMGAECDPAADGAGCCDVQDNIAWSCSCSAGACTWQMEDCDIDPACR